MRGANVQSIVLSLTNASIFHFNTSSVEQKSFEWFATLMDVRLWMEESFKVSTWECIMNAVLITQNAVASVNLIYSADWLIMHQIPL